MNRNLQSEDTQESTGYQITIDEPILWTLLRTKRPDKGIGIEQCMGIIESLAESYNPVKMFRDSSNNLWVDLRKGYENTTMFMGHMDTVESKAGSIDIIIDARGIVSTGGKDVLGADDGAGIALLVSLMEFVPALYLFTQNEEHGGSGGSYAASKPMADMVKDIDRIISFDRKGTADICGEQVAGTLASRTFVKALSDQLNMGHSWARGSYTDNSEFQGLVNEIVNVSIGYEFNHCSRETFDYDYFVRLREACLLVDWDNLPNEGPDTSLDYSYSSSAYESNGLYGGYEYPKYKPYEPNASYTGIAKLESVKKITQDVPSIITPAESECMELIDILGIQDGTWEADMILDSLHRCYSDGYDAGLKQGKKIAKTLEFRTSRRNP